MTKLSGQESNVKIGKKICCTTKISDLKGTLLRLFASYSSLVTLQRAAAWIFRFVAYLKWKCCNNANQPPVGPLVSEKLEFAFMSIIKATQRQAFSKVLDKLPEHGCNDSPRN